MPKRKLDQEEESIALSIRLPKSMRETIERKAIESRRSLNQEILWLLEMGIKYEEEQKKDQAK